MRAKPFFSDCSLITMSRLERGDVGRMVDVLRRPILPGTMNLTVPSFAFYPQETLC
jgi:hypothetical protein